MEISIPLCHWSASDLTEIAFRYLEPKQTNYYPGLCNLAQSWGALSSELRATWLRASTLIQAAHSSALVFFSYSPDFMEPSDSPEVQAYNLLRLFLSMHLVQGMCVAL